MSFGASKFPAVDREQVLAFRLNSHHLAARLQPGSLLLAAGICGIQNTPPGSAALSLHARVASLIPEDLLNALYVEKSLLQAWSLRGAPYLFPTQERHIFTHGLLPLDEEAIRAFIPGVEPALEKIGITAVEVVNLTAAGLFDALDHRERTKDELGRELALQVAQQLSLQQQSAWAEPSWYARGQSLGESVVRFALPVIALKGVCCHSYRRENKAYLARLDQWLDAKPVERSGEAGRAELVRRYLHAYGPSTPAHFAEWAGISAAQAAFSWRLIEGELLEVSYASRKTWLLDSDRDNFVSPPAPIGIRFLPPHDPYLLMRDRPTLIPEKRLQPRIWRAAGSTGVILADGVCIAIWRGSKRGKRVVLTVDPFTSISQAIRSQVEGEAGTLHPYWNCMFVEIRFSEIR